MALDLAPRTPLRVLFVEDSEDDAALIVRHLQRAGYAVEYFRVETRDSFVNALANAPWDVVISDHSMPKFSSMDALRILRECGHDAPFIIVSGTIGEETAVEAMRSGAHDYVLKHNLTRLGPVIARELGDTELRRQARSEREARQAIERQLQQAQKMEAVGRLAGGIAHDFNNLLTAILGFTGLALERHEAGRAVRFELEQVKLAAERAARFTRQLLAFSRHQMLAPRVIDPAESIEALAPMLRQLIGEDVVLDTDAPRGVAHVKVDPGQFEQLVMNLAVNARDAMPNGGRLAISCAPVHLDDGAAGRLQLAPGRYVRVSAADTGIGMDAETKARIFEPFFTTKPPGEGTGLGLSTVYGILQQSGGSIDVESEPQRGATFHMYLPAAARSEETPSRVRRARQLAAATRRRILVAEDEEAVRVLVRTVLADAGFDVIDAASGMEAAAVLETLAQPIDLLITDVVMPGMLGPDLARLATERSPETRVLYMTGYATHSSVPAQFMQEEDALLQKPFLPEQLLARVHERLGLT
jgi:signal transduction histidine kinase